MPEVSIHNILNYSSNSQQGFLPPASQNNANNNSTVPKQNLQNFGITMSRFNSSTNSNINDTIKDIDNSNIVTVNSTPNNSNLFAQVRQKRCGSTSLTSLNQYHNKRRITKPDPVNYINYMDNLPNGQILSNNLINSRTTSIVNRHSTHPTSSTAQSTELNNSKKLMNVTLQPSYTLSDITKTPFDLSPNNDERINNNKGVSPNRNNVQNNSPLGNTAFYNESPIVSPEQILNHQLQFKSQSVPLPENELYQHNTSINNNNYNNIEKSSSIQISTMTNKIANDMGMNSSNIALSSDIPNSSDNINNGNTDEILNSNEGYNVNNNDDDDNNNNMDNNTHDGTDDNNEDNKNNSNRANETTNNKKSGQALVQKLQDIYKLIVKQEIELQDRCAQLTTSQTTELKHLWTIYRINIDLINNYSTFITTALLPSQSLQDIMIGEEIIEIYRIERRLWVYGTITFLDVLKNFSNFMDPDVCSQFITHVFISLSTMLIDIPPKHAIPWLQRLGDLSRMAIALYPSGFIDWKLSAEYWYLEAMKLTYSHGKLYYHMSTVQQNTLEAFVNLGKSVFCQDTFTPSQQYMQLVIDNIYQRTFVDRTNNGNNIRNSDLIDYLKHSEVMLLPSFLGNGELQRVVLNYFQDRFGVDYNDNNMFLCQRMFSQIPSSLKFYFRHAPAFAESHILQLIGFGDPKNPFALLFDLPKYLKERKDKKDKSKSKANGTAGIDNSTLAPSSATTRANSPYSPQILADISSSMTVDNTTLQLSTFEFFENIECLKSPIKKADIYIWIKSLDFVNLTSLKCSMIVLNKFLNGPLLIALPHFLPWTYFIMATLIKVRRDFQDDANSLRFWRILVKRIFPWNTIINFLNVLMAYALDNFHQNKIIAELCSEYSQFDTFDSLLKYLNENEDLPEVWKCWGTLWYDVISDKCALKADNFKDLGIKDHMFLDLPIDGIDFDSNDEIGEKFWKRAIRIIFLFKGIAENFDMGLKINTQVTVHCNDENVDPNHILKTFSFKAMPYNEPTSDKFNELIPLCEEISEINSDFNAVPSLSVIEGESIFEYVGYKKFYPNSQSFDKNGDIVSSSLYTTCLNNTSVNTGNTSDLVKSSSSVNMDGSNNSVTQKDIFSSEEEWFVNDIQNSDVINKDTTYFVFDATSWLRHFAHIYKLSTNNVLKFAVCLTTFQELRFLRKSKDENVVEAAARAIITMRQLYREGKLLPLRFTGNIAADIEEHLEVEEQITWRSHVDEFVIEAVMKAQNKFQNNSIGMPIEFNYIVLVTDDITMAKNAKDRNIMTFTTHFIFSFCTKMGIENDVCTN